MLSRLGALAFAIALLCPALVRADEVGVRTSVTPSAGSAVLVHPRVALTGEFRGRFVADGPRFGDRGGFAASVGPRVLVHEMITIGAAYRYAHGHFPLEGPGAREHTAALSLGLASRGERFVVGNSLQLDLRTYRPHDEGWGFHARPRDSVRFTGIFKPWLKLSGTIEALVQPTYGLVDMLQLRTGVALHGEIALTKGERRKRKPALFWIAAAQLGLSPVSLARRADADDADPLSLRERQAIDRASMVDMVVLLGLSGLF